MPSPAAALYHVGAAPRPRAPDEGRTRFLRRARITVEQQLVVEPSLSLEPLAVHPNALLIKSLYSAIGAQDLTAIDACYDDEAYFQDIAFRRHKKRRIMEMWRYVCHGKPDVTFDVNTISADDRTGTGRWRAKYVFGKTDRKPGVRIDNAITSAFVFRNGLIV